MGIFDFLKQRKATNFTLWVGDENPDETYLLGLMMRVCEENPNEVPEKFRKYVEGDKSRQLSYRLTRNHDKGGLNVEFTLK